GSAPRTAAHDGAGRQRMEPALRTGCGAGRSGGTHRMNTIQHQELTDAELVKLAQQGDNRAFDELVKRYENKVYRLAFKILRHEDDAGEALQDAFMSAYKG